MSDSDRGKRSKTELVAFAGIAAAFIVAILVWAIPAHLSYSNQASYNAEYHQRWANEQIGRNCISVPATASERCVDEARATSEERQREERDLEAQQKMALWTSIMGAMAVIGVGLSGFGVYLIWRTWDATREAAENSRKTLFSYLAKERAILRTENARFNFEEKSTHKSGFRVNLDNVGPSNATIKSIAWSYLPNGMSAWPQNMQVTDFSPLIAPAASNTQTPHLGAKEFLSDPFWLVGTIEYTTLDAESYHTHFCYKLRFVDGAGYGPDSWYAEPARVAGMPRNT